MPRRAPSDGHRPELSTARVILSEAKDLSGILIVMAMEPRMLRYAQRDMTTFSVARSRLTGVARYGNPANTGRKQDQ